MQVQSKFYVHVVFRFICLRLKVTSSVLAGEACKVRLCYLGMAGSPTAYSCRYIEQAVALATQVLDEGLETPHDKNNTLSDTV